MHIIECSSDVCSYDLEAVQLNLHGRFRRIDVNDTHAVEVFALLNGLARASVELERLLGIKSSQIYMPELPIGPGAVERQAEEAAQGLRHMLGFCLSPIREQVSRLENRLGARVFGRGLPYELAGVFEFDEMVGDRKSVGGGK